MSLIAALSHNDQFADPDACKIEFYDDYVNHKDLLVRLKTLITSAVNEEHIRLSSTAPSTAKVPAYPNVLACKDMVNDKNYAALHVFGILLSRLKLESLQVHDGAKHGPGITITGLLELTD